MFMKTNCDTKAIHVLYMLCNLLKSILTYIKSIKGDVEK